MAINLQKVWADESSRAMEVMGGEPIRHKRTVDDRVVLEFTAEEWRRIFNLDEGYKPADSAYKAYGESAPIQIYFIRSFKEGDVK